MLNFPYYQVQTAREKIPKATSALFQIYKVHLTHLHMVAHADESLTHVCATSRLAINYASAKLGIIKTLERENARVSGTLLPEFSFETVFEIKKSCLSRGSVGLGFIE